MSEIIKCEKCGAVMCPIDPSKPVGMTCPNCGWGWATTYVDPMLDDNTIYKVSLSNGNKASKSAIKAVAKVSGKNFIQAKRISCDNSLKVRIAAFQAVGPGSIPGCRIFFYFFFIWLTIINKSNISYIFLLKMEKTFCTIIYFTYITFIIKHIPTSRT